MAKALDFNKARADYHRVADSSDNAWNAYRKARERLAKKRETFAAQQAFIDAGQAVARAQDRLAEKETLLRSAAFQLATDELTSRATPAELTVRMEQILAEALAAKHN